MPRRKNPVITILAPDGATLSVSGPLDRVCAHELINHAVGKILPPGSRPYRLLRGGLPVAAYSPFRRLADYGLRDGDVLETVVDAGQAVHAPCFLCAYRVMTAALESYETAAIASAALNGHLPPSGRPAGDVFPIASSPDA